MIFCVFNVVKSTNKRTQSKALVHIGYPIVHTVGMNEKMQT